MQQVTWALQACCSVSLTATTPGARKQLLCPPSCCQSCHHQWLHDGTGLRFLQQMWQPMPCCEASQLQHGPHDMCSQAMRQVKGFGCANDS